MSNVFGKDFSIGELMYMRENEGLSNREIAERCGVSYFTILKWIGKQPRKENKMGNETKWNKDLELRVLANKETEVTELYRLMDKFNFAGTPDRVEPINEGKYKGGYWVYIFKPGVTENTTFIRMNDEDLDKWKAIKLELADIKKINHTAKRLASEIDADFIPEDEKPEIYVPETGSATIIDICIREKREDLPAFHGIDSYDDMYMKTEINFLNELLDRIGTITIYDAAKAIGLKPNPAFVFFGWIRGEKIIIDYEFDGDVVQLRFIGGLINNA